MYASERLLCRKDDPMLEALKGLHHGVFIFRVDHKTNQTEIVSQLGMSDSRRRHNVDEADASAESGVREGRQQEIHEAVTMISFPDISS